MSAHDLIERLENIRKRYCMNMYIPIIVMLVCFFIGATLPFESYGTSGKIMWFGIGFVAGAALFSLGKYKNINLKDEYRHIYKDSLVNSVLAKYFKDFDYSDWRNGLDQVEVMKTGLVKIGEVFSSEDLLTGTYNGVAFRQSDVKTLNLKTSRDEQVIDYKFTGRVIQFDMAGKKAFTVKALSTGFSSYMEQTNNSIQLENVEFNQKFKVFSLDEHDIFYVLTPTVMEKLLELQKNYGCIGVKFTQEALYVAVSGIDTFDTELDSSKKIEWYKETSKIEKTAKLIIDVIDMMTLVHIA